jgi:threonine/homoserine/homoserine lactone efflux protein
MVAASGATFGFRRTLPHMLGVSIGFPAMLVAVTLGAGDVLRAHPELHAIMRWAGAAYLLWLAWHIATAAPAEAESGGRRRNRPLRFLEAALFQWINPKAWVIALGAIATYTSADGIRGQALILALVFLVICIPSIALWTAIGAGAARLLRTRRALRLFNLAMAALLIASLLPLLASE